MEEAITQIFRDNGYEDGELEHSFKNGNANSSDNVSDNHFEDMLLLLRKEELKSEARKRQLSLTGNKIDLVLVLKTYEIQFIAWPHIIDNFLI